MLTFSKLLLVRLQQVKILLLRPFRLRSKCPFIQRKVFVFFRPIRIDIDCYLHFYKLRHIVVKILFEKILLRFPKFFQESVASLWNDRSCGPKKYVSTFLSSSSGPQSQNRKPWPNLTNSNRKTSSVVQSSYYHTQCERPVDGEFAAVSQLGFLLETLLISCSPDLFLRVLPAHHQRNG